MFTTGAKVVLDTHASQSGLPLLTGARADTRGRDTAECGTSGQFTAAAITLPPSRSPSIVTGEAEAIMSG
eukprot:7195934-Prymnesium_polylepis.1